MHTIPFSGKYANATLRRANENLKRRDACYKPNIWSNDFIDLLCIKHYKMMQGQAFEWEVNKLKTDLMKFFNQTDNVESKRRLIEKIVRLGLSDLFEEQIKNVNFKEGIQLTEAAGNTYLKEEGSVLTFTNETRSDNSQLKKQRVILPLQREVPWFEVREEIHRYYKTEDQDDDGVNFTLMNLAALNFNTVQVIHQEELKDLARWWRNLGLTRHMSFARDRLVESFLFAVGVAHQPRYSTLRKCLAKVINFILLIDDIYDIYGFLDELECFTRAVERWDLEEIHILPESMKACFRALYRTTNDIATVISKETGRSNTLPLITKAWADFCNSLLVEARWYYTGYTPSLDGYLSSAWISSSGPLLSTIVSLLSTNDQYSSMDHKKLTKKKEIVQDHDLVYHLSFIIRLCNDLGTTEAELQRGDSPSSILCYMREEGVAEDVARRKVKEIIESSWEQMGEFLVKQSPHELSPSSNHLVNVARVARFIYSNGDGIGIQDGTMQHQIKRTLIDPIVC